jgi:type I restriction enzyme M protein
MNDQKLSPGNAVDPSRINNHAAFIWSVANLLRGPYNPHEYGKVILPLTVLRRMDSVLEPTKAKVLERHMKLKGSIDNIGPVLEAVSGEQFYNTSPLDFRRLLDDPTQIAGNLRSYIAGFSSSAREIIEKFEFDSQITKLHDKNLLYLVVSKFAEIDLHPKIVSNLEMGYMYEELIRRFSELSKEDAGDHYTPREVIRLMVNLLFIEDNEVLTKAGTVRTVFDPACGTGGMLSVAEDYLRQLNPEAHLEVFGQELNDETYAICRSDMMLKGQDASHITVGNSFDEDGHAGRSFDYCIANPPFGVEWKQAEKFVKDEAEKLGFRGRFGAGLPRIDDSSLMFLQHMIAKMKPIEEGGSRIAIVFNGSPLFSGGAKSGESEIRRWIIENDWLEAVVALPDQLFYNTGIFIYCWIVTNRKSEERRGKVQLINSREYFTKMRRNLGEKRKEISPAQIEEISRLYADFRDCEQVKIFSNEEFGYMHITVERPLRAEWRPSEFASRLAENGGEEWMRLDEPTIAAALAKVPVQSNQKKTEAAIKHAVPHLTAKQAKAIADLVRVAADSIVSDTKGQPEPDPDLRDHESVPLPTTGVTWEADVTERLAKSEYRTAINTYVTAEVHPHVPDAWVDFDKTKIGYEIPLTRHFYKYVPPRPLVEIDSEIKALEVEIRQLLHAVAE